MALEPQPPFLPQVDNEVRILPLGQPGLQDFDNPIYQYVSRGEDSKQIQNRLTDEMTDALMKNYNEVQKSILQKMFCYPESILNINDSSFVNGHEVPRNVLRITILDYAGGNLVSKETKAKFQNFTNKIAGPGEFRGDNFIEKAYNGAMEASELANSFAQNPALYKSEIQNYQDRADQLSQGAYSVNNITNAAIQEGASNKQASKYRDHVNKFLNSNYGKDFAARYLTSNKDPMQMRSFVDQVSSKTAINIQMLPDEVKSIIYLYSTADNLNYSYSTSWSHGKEAKGMQGSLADIQNMLANVAEGKGSEQVKSDLIDLAAARIIRGAMNDQNSDDAVRIILAKTGKAPAQNYEYLFDSVGRRSFAVNVNFYAKSRNEVNNIAKIIAAFKYYSHPSRPNRSALVKVPCVFLLENLTYTQGKGWVENLYLPKYKICALQNTNVNYGQNGTLITHEAFAEATSGPVFKSPVSISLSLNFQEMHVLIREDLPKPENFFDGNIQNNGYY